MKYLLDTNVISELRRMTSGRAAPMVAAWSRSVKSTDAFLSVMTILELERGWLLLKSRDQARAQVIQNWLDQDLLVNFAERILDVDVQVARRCAFLHVPITRPERDAMIAATAFVHGLIVVTRNERDFAGMGVAVLNPWAFSASA